MIASWWGLGLELKTAKRAKGGMHHRLHSARNKSVLPSYGWKGATTKAAQHIDMHKHAKRYKACKATELPEILAVICKEIEVGDLNNLNGNAQLCSGRSIEPVLRLKKDPPHGI